MVLVPAFANIAKLPRLALQAKSGKDGESTCKRL